MNQQWCLYRKGSIRSTGSSSLAFAQAARSSSWCSSAHSVTRLNALAESRSSGRRIGGRQRKAQRPRGKPTCNECKSFDTHESLCIGILRVRMRWSGIGKVHLDHDPLESTLSSGIDGRTLQSGEDLLRWPGCQPKIEGIGAQVDFTRPDDRAALVDRYGLEHISSGPRLKDPSASQIVEIHNTFDTVCVFQEKAKTVQRNCLYCLFQSGPLPRILARGDRNTHSLFPVSSDD